MARREAELKHTGVTAKDFADTRKVQLDLWVASIGRMFGSGKRMSIKDWRLAYLGYEDASEGKLEGNK